MGDKTQKKETRRRENLFKYMRNIIEMADVHICKMSLSWQNYKILGRKAAWKL